MAEQISKRFHITPQAARKVMGIGIVGIAAVILTVAMITIANSASKAINVEIDATTVIPDNTLPAVSPVVEASEIAEPVEEPTPWAPDPDEVNALARTLYGECRGVKSQMEQAAVAWCVLNRVDSRYYPNTVMEVITQPRQFHGYDEDYPVLPALKAIAEDVLAKWHLEKEGEEDVGRVLPKSYIYFVGDGVHNYFTEEFLSKDYWDFSLPNPYEN
ncbi:MAG: cell wall hydrolase [Clostridia bacterium]|nr:cell wall hydrolase [Clostridia bacterium]